MIRAVFSPHRIAVSGHSGCGGRGQDIVCAAASILMEATAAAVRARGVPAVIDIGDGSFAITVPGNGHLLETARQGFALLAQHYGRYVTVQHLQTGGTADAG